MTAAFQDKGQKKVLIVVYGGSASGKSAYAEERALRLAGKEGKAVLPGRTDSRIYMAAMKPYGEEAQTRIRRHREMRAGKGFRTVERYTDVGGLDFPRHPAVILLECMSNLTANECFDSEGYMGRKRCGKAAGQRSGDNAFSPEDVKETASWIVRGIQDLSAKTEHLVVVTLDVFRDLDGPDFKDKGTAFYMRCLGEVNRNLAQIADEVTEVVYSIPVPVKMIS